MDSAPGQVDRCPKFTHPIAWFGGRDSDFQVNCAQFCAHPRSEPSYSVAKVEETELSVRVPEMNTVALYRTQY
jgi:hypothetical protein